MAALSPTEAWNQAHGRRHRTPAQRMRQMLCVLLRWFPEREFTFTGDGGFSPHASAAQAQRPRRKLTFVGRFHAHANLFTSPPQRLRSEVGRPRVKGAKLPFPAEVVAHARRQRLNVSWYGGGRRNVAVVTGTGWWYRGGAKLVHVRWVYVKDLDGTHREEYFFTTDVTLAPKEIIEAFTQRWSIEVTFEEARAYLGLKSPRVWSEKAVLRVTPCLLGLFSLVVLIYAALPEREKKKRSVQWAGKQTTTFSDALTAVRRWLWLEGVFKTYACHGTFSKLPRRLRQTLLYALAPAA